MALLLGYDVGSSSIKASLIDSQTGRAIASAASPDRELPIKSRGPGWAEQHPHLWWQNVVAATAKLMDAAGFDPASVAAVGISYQMHGLVIIGKDFRPLRDSIIWCDSRAVEIGRKAAAVIGPERCLKSLLNLPGNFTASKLRWVRENEPDNYTKIHKMMLPGDYIAMMMTGRISTTVSGLSEGVMWDFEKERPCEFILENYDIDPALIGEIVPTFGIQGRLTSAAAAELGLKAGTAVTYRAGDQPNNAFSLNVLEPGQVAVTAGTSGVVYCVSDKRSYDPKSRVNIFAHVNHQAAQPRYGVLLCLNGAGILYSWLKHNLAGTDYDHMNELAAKVPAGSQGLIILPYGNGAERTLENNDIGASVHGWSFNAHTRENFLRASQEGIACALNYGLGIMRGIHAEPRTVRAGRANMFLSGLFCRIFASVTGTTVELFNTDGSQGAARAAGIGAGIYNSPQEAFVGLEPVEKVEPQKELTEACARIYSRWEKILASQMTSIASP